MNQSSRASAVRTLAIGLALLVSMLSAPYASAASAPDGVSVFAKVPAPGSPEGLVVSPDGKTVYTSTYQSIQGGAQGPSKIFAYSTDGTLQHTYTLQGQKLDGTQGAGGLAFDGSGLLYAVAVQPDRVVTIDPQTGAQHDYATFPELAQCSTPAEVPAYPCTQSTTTNPPLTPGIAFGPDGSLYVTDTDQAVIWKVPAGGGTPTVWLTDSRFTSDFALNKILVTPDARHLIFTETSHEDPASGAPGNGAVWELDIQPDGEAGSLHKLWQSSYGVFPDGIAMSDTGHLWVSTLGASSGVIELSADGQQLSQLPASELDNQQQEIPFDDPSSVTFLGTNLLVANSAFLTNNANDWAILSFDSHQHGAAPFLPRVPLPGVAPAAAPLELTVKPASIRHGHAAVLRIDVRWHGRPAIHAKIAAGRAHTRTNKRGIAHLRVHPRKPGRLRVTALFRHHRARASVTVR